MTEDNSKEPQKKTIFGEWVDPTPAEMVIGFLLIVGLVWFYILLGIISDEGTLRSVLLGRTLGFVIVAALVASVFAAINFAIKRDRTKAKRWWVGAYILWGMGESHNLISTATP